MPATLASLRGVRRIDRTVRERYEVESPECSVIDILTDVRHYCDKHGLDFADLDRIAYNHYVEEK